MSMSTSILRPVVMPPELIGHPAPCDLFNASGVLLLRAGALIVHGRRDPSQPLRFLCPAAFAARISHAHPARELTRIAATLADDLVGALDPGRFLLRGRQRRVRRDDAGNGT